jgi:nucleoside-diphosphate-sugar epimerase
VNNQEMVSINPVLVIGQVIPNHNKYAGNVDLGTSNLQIKQLVTGETKTIQKKLQGFVDVKDVARAHVRAMQVPHANGNRYLCCSETLSWAQVCHLLKKMYPQHPIPQVTDQETDHHYVFSNQKIRDHLGIEFISTEQSLRETITSFIRMGII